MNRLRLITAAMSLFGVLGLAACAGAVSDENGDGTIGDDQEITAGKMCGGIAGLRCKAGLTCKLSGNHPDASGTCVAPKPGEAGGMCGGLAGFQCKAGLTCKFASSSGTGSGPPPGAMGMPFPDASGTCVAVSSGPPPGAVGLPQPPHK